MVVFAEEYEVFDFGVAACPPRHDVVGLAMFGLSPAAGETASTGMSLQSHAMILASLTVIPVTGSRHA
ncbi:hypothetical protein GCM10009754_76790 [Amycolatopsis minnesotensis]|uniref:Uncharacterized protein n=1 Tax=Amycolatopsis minnesotensis TaxID=337894 RepID=A0ABP5DWF2_9PSEU